MKAFLEFIEEQELIDLPMQGALYTWTNKQEIPLMSRLDHLLISPAREDHFNQLQKLALPNPISDHIPLILQQMIRKDGLRPFRFELMWLKVEGFKEKLSNWWTGFSFGETESFCLGPKAKGTERCYKKVE